MPGLESQPPLVQMTFAVLTFFVAGVVWWLSVFRKAGGPAVSKDVVVPNVSVMDSSTLRDAAQTLRESIQGNDRRDQIQRAILAELEQQTSLMREAIDVLKLVDARISQEYTRQRLKDRN